MVKRAFAAGLSGSGSPAAAPEPPRECCSFVDAAVRLLISVLRFRAAASGLAVRFGAMNTTGPRGVYRTSTSLDGFIADSNHSLAWLFALEHGDAQAADHAEFLDGLAVLVEGSTTYDWMLAEAGAAR